MSLKNIFYYGQFVELFIVFDLVYTNASTCMKKYIISIFIFSAMYFFAKAQPDNWQVYTSDIGLFSVETPYEIKVKEQQIKTGIGELIQYTYLASSPFEKDDNQLFMIQWVQYPDGLISADSTDMIEELLDITRDEAVKSVGGELIYKDVITKQGRPGRLWKIQYNEGRASIKSNVFYDDNRMYTISVVSYRNMSVNPGVDRFISSFRFASKKMKP